MLPTYTVRYSVIASCIGIDWNQNFRSLCPSLVGPARPMCHTGSSLATEPLPDTSPPDAPPPPPSLPFSASRDLLQPPSPGTDASIFRAVGRPVPDGLQKYATDASGLLCSVYDYTHTLSVWL